MEIEIDTAAVHEIVRSEYAQTRADLAAFGPMQALQSSQARHDARLESAHDAASLACKGGCFWCCYFSVDVRPVEVLRIVDVMRGLPVAEQQRIAAEARANRTVLAEMSEEDRARHNVKCPFLAVGRCAIYAARPQTCRNYHATNSLGCRLAFEQPDNVDIDPEFAPGVYQAGLAHVEAFSKALRDERYDTRAYELNSALALTLEDPERRYAAFAERERVFPELGGTEVQFELVDDQYGSIGM